MSVFPFYWSKCNHNMLSSVGVKQAGKEWINSENDNESKVVGL